MKKWVRILLIILAILVPVGAFVSTCTCTYLFDWNGYAFWWSWFAIVWLIDLFVGGYIFYKKNRTDETKTFWLLVIVVLPIVGALIALIQNYKLHTEFYQTDNDHTRLQAAIFRAKKSIKIYSDSFFASHDTFKALNFAVWKGVEVKLVITEQPKKWKQQMLIYNLEKYLEDKIQLYFTNKEIHESFVMVDDEYFVWTNKNFNFSNIYAGKFVQVGKEINKYKNIWTNDVDRSSLFPIEHTPNNPFKKAYFKVINIFYCFF